MDWSKKVELFEQIRREYEFGIGTIAGVARKLKVHRRMVREAVGSAIPKRRKKTNRPRWKIAAAMEFVDRILEADKKAPRKQRHTAHRIWERIRCELPDVEYVSERFGNTCMTESWRWVSSCKRRSFLRAMTGA